MKIVRENNLLSYKTEVISDMVSSMEHLDPFEEDFFDKMSESHAMHAIREIYPATPNIGCFAVTVMRSQEMKAMKQKYPWAILACYPDDQEGVAKKLFYGHRPISFQAFFRVCGYSTVGDWTKRLVTIDTRKQIRLVSDMIQDAFGRTPIRRRVRRRIETERCG